MTQHKHYETARRAFYNTSFTPEKRAEQYCAGLDHTLKELREAGVRAESIAKYERMWVDWMGKKSRCMSSMITGPANFPTARNQKRLDAEHKAHGELIEYEKKLLAAACKEAYYEKHPEARPIKSGDDDALDRLREKLAKLEHNQEMMKAFNKAARKKGATVESVKDACPTFSEATIAKLMEPDCFNYVGFAPFQLTNNNAKIKSTRDRIAQLEKRKNQGEQELTIGGVRVVQNPDDMRLQLFFDGKPSAEMRSLLKSHAFKWSPRNEAWQRQLTNNALYALKTFIKPALEGLNHDAA